MAAGGLDANGIYQYGEDDVLATPGFSDFLNLGQQSVSDALEELRAVIAPGSWVTPNLQNSWAHYGGSYGDVQWRKNQSCIEMTGLCRNGTLGTIFTLPAGSRPANQLMFIAPASNGLCRVDIQPNGEVKVIGFYAGASTTFVGFSGIRFALQE